MAVDATFCLDPSGMSWGTDALPIGDSVVATLTAITVVLLCYSCAH